MSFIHLFNFVYCPNYNKMCSLFEYLFNCVKYIDYTGLYDPLEGI